MGSGGELPFTGWGSGILTGAAIVMTGVGAVLTTAAGPIAGALGAGAAFTTRLFSKGKH